MSTTWRLQKSESRTLSRKEALELAAEHAGLPHSPVERDLDQGRVKKLAAIIREGLALPFNWATVKFDGRNVRMNGQHSSAAIMEVGADLPDKLTFHVDLFEATDRKGMVELFRQFDQRWSSRTSADIAGAYQGLVPELSDCNKKVIKVAAEGLSWCMRMVEGGEAPTGDDTYDLLHKPNKEFQAFFLWANGIVNARRELLRKEVMAAMYKTHDASQSGASKFWRQVSLGINGFTDDQDPGAVLTSELTKALEDREYREKEFETAAHYYKKCVKAWNAFCVGQRISSLKVAKSKGWPDVLRPGDEQEQAA